MKIIERMAKVFMINAWVFLACLLVQSIVVLGCVYIGYHFGYVARHQAAPPPIIDIESIVDSVHERMKPKDEDEEDKKEEGFY